MVDSEQWARLAKLGEANRTEEAIRYSDELVAATSNPDEIASLLSGIISFNSRLGRLAEARQTLQKLKGLEIPDVFIRLNAEFLEPCLLIQEGRTEEGLAAFTAILDRDGKFLQEDRLRYLYEDIQFRRAWALIGLSRFAEALPIAQESMSFAFEELSDEMRMSYALAVCLDETGDKGSAVREYFRAIGFALPDDLMEDARFRLARLLMQSGALAQARKQLELIIEGFTSREPVVPRRNVYDYLSVVCRSLGDETGSERYKQLSDMDPR